MMAGEGRFIRFILSLSIWQYLDFVLEEGNIVTS